MSDSRSAQFHLPEYTWEFGSDLSLVSADPSHKPVVIRTDPAWPPVYVYSSLASVPVSGVSPDETSPDLIEGAWREARQRLVGATGKALKDHRALYAGRLLEATEANSRRSVVDLLSELSAEHGVAWSDIAAMLGISVPALRKWRKTTSGTTPENHRKLAALAGFFALLADAVAAPANWMSMPLVPGYNVTPADVYSDSHATALLDLAAGNAGANAPAVLDSIDAGWRDKWLSRYEVFRDDDGELSMRPREA